MFFGVLVTKMHFADLDLFMPVNVASPLKTEVLGSPLSHKCTWLFHRTKNIIAMTESLHYYEWLFRVFDLRMTLYSSTITHLKFNKTLKFIPFSIEWQLISDESSLCTYPQLL